MPVVLDLRNPNGQLSKYIFGKVCKNLGITKSHVIAWNLVNCYFIDKPRMLAVDPQVETYLINRFYQVDGAKNDWKTVRFLYHYFLEFGKQELEYVVNKYEPRLLVSLGEPVFRVLRHAYALPQRVVIPENLADFCCERSFSISVGNKAVLWLAVPHEPTGDRNPHYKKVLAGKLPVVGRSLAAELEGRD